MLNWEKKSKGNYWCKKNNQKKKDKHFVIIIIIIVFLKNSTWERKNKNSQKKKIRAKNLEQKEKKEGISKYENWPGRVENDVTMVLILNGNSEIDAHISSNIYHLMHLRHFIRSRSVTNPSVVNMFWVTISYEHHGCNWIYLRKGLQENWKGPGDTSNTLFLYKVHIYKYIYAARIFA